MNSSVIDIYTWSLSIQLIFAVLPFVLIFIGVIIILLVAWGREYEIVDSSIKSCSYLEQLKAGIGAKSYRARWMVVCGVCAIMVFPAYHLRLGLVSSCEIRNFPSGLKSKLVIAAWMNMIGVFWLVIAFVLIKFGG